MKCGFYENDVTPPLGSIIPGGFGARYSANVLDKLYVRACVIGNGDDAVAIASVDACGITIDITERIRNRVCSMTSLYPEQVMVMATHSHGGGPTLNWGEEIVTDEHYLRCLVEKTADAVVCAYNRTEESQVFLGKDELSDVSFIRIYKMKDGRWQTNPTNETHCDIVEPYTTIDPEVYVLAVKQGDKYAGAIVNYANHPAIVFSNENTGDYVSVLSRELKKEYGDGFVTVFINGACGNINHLNPLSEKKPQYKDYKEAYTTVGKRLAETVVRAVGNAEVMMDNAICHSVSEIEVKFRKPTMEQLINAKNVFDSLGDELIDSTPSNPNYWDTFYALQALKIEADKRTKRSIHLQLFRVGSCYIFGNPCQIFVEYGKKIKNVCKDTCFVSAFANDYCGYVPIPEAMEHDTVYEAKLAPSSALEPATGDKVADALIEMYRKIQ